jgi:hypothetical protein
MLGFSLPVKSTTFGRMKRVYRPITLGPDPIRIASSCPHN